MEPVVALAPIASRVIIVITDTLAGSNKSESENQAAYLEMGRLRVYPIGYKIPYCTDPTVFVCDP